MYKTVVTKCFVLRRKVKAPSRAPAAADVDKVVDDHEEPPFQVLYRRRILLIRSVMSERNLYF